MSTAIHTSVAVMLSAMDENRNANRPVSSISLRSLMREGSSLLTILSMMPLPDR